MTLRGLDKTSCTLVALQHGPGEVRALALHSCHLNPHEAHVLKVDAAFNVTNVDSFISDPCNKLADRVFGVSIVSAE